MLGAMKMLLGRLARAVRRAGLGPVLAAVRDRVDLVLLSAHRPLLSAISDGIRLQGFLRHRSFLAEIDGADYEPTLSRLIADALEPGCLFIDGGAHIGYYSVLAARLGAQVIALEPDPYNRAALKVNVRHLGVEVRAIALSDKPGEAMFHPSLSTTGSSLVRRTDIALARAVSVATTTVDELTTGRRDRPIVVKLDLEGHEAAALEGAIGTLADAERLVIVAEVNPGAAGVDDGAAGMAVAQRLAAAGLHVDFIDQAGHIGPVPASRVKGNIIARRPPPRDPE